MFGRKKSALRKATSSVHGVANPLEPAAVVRPHRHEIGGGVGMQGYAPAVGVTTHRVLCNGCKKPVIAGVRHICIHNAHNYLETLTEAERNQLIADLQALGVKP